MIVANEDEVHRILEALKFTTADGLKVKQRKFSAARNTIIDEALAYRCKDFFTDEEQDTLAAAARILGNFKTKIEHAKEIRARDEKRREAHLNKCKSKRKALLDRLVAQPTTIKEHEEAVLFHLALQEHYSEIAKRAYFGHGIRYIEEDLDRGLDPKYGHLTVRRVGSQCALESHRWLEEHLWAYDIEPDPAVLESLLDRYRNEWRDEIAARFRKFLDRYIPELTKEIEQEEGELRARNAVKRRSQIKVVKSGE